MPSGVRAKARQERERQAAAAAAARTAADARTARRRERRARWSSLSRPTGRQTGTLAARRRLQVRLLIVALVVLNIFVWLLEPSGPIRALVLVASVLAAPVLYTVLFRKA